MKSEKIKITKPVFAYNKSGEVKEIEIETRKGNKTVPQTIQKSFVVDQTEFNEELYLIENYPGKDRDNDFKSISCKIHGLGTYLIPNELKKKYSMKGSGREDNFGYFVSTQKNKISDLKNDLKKIKVTKQLLINTAKDKPRSYLAEKLNIKTSKKKAPAKVASKDDPANNLAESIEQIKSLGLSKEKTAELVGDLIKQK